MECLIGQISIFGFNFAPYQWAQCNGQILSISQNTALFSILGTYFGGNGTSTYALPDLRGRTPVHAPINNTSDPVLGETGGMPQVTLISTNIPMHQHQVLLQPGPSSISPYINATTAAASTNTPVNGMLLADTTASTGGNLTYSSSAPTVPLNGTGSLQAQLSGSLLPTPGVQIAVNVMPPYIALNYCIALYGVFPSRS